MITRQSEATWHGDLRSGNGTMRVGRDAQEQSFTFISRAERSEDGYGPEELVAAALAGCYAMALSNHLASCGHTPERVHASATVHLGPDPAGGLHISRIDLVVKANVPGLGEDTFQEFAAKAKTGCPISKLFAGTTIVLDAALAS